MITVTKIYIRNLSYELKKRHLKDADLMRPGYTPEMAAAFRAAISNTPGMTIGAAADLLGIKESTFRTRLQSQTGKPC